MALRLVGAGPREGRTKTRNDWSTRHAEGRGSRQAPVSGVCINQTEMLRFDQDDTIL